MKSKNKYIILILAYIVGLSIAQNTTTITLDEFLNKLERTHPLFVREDMNADILREQQKSLTGAEDWNFTSETGINYTQQNQDMYEYTAGASIEGSVSRHFWNTGGSINAGVSISGTSMDYIDNPMYLTCSDSKFDNSIYVGYSQPLLRNWKGFLSKFQYELKGIAIDLSEVEAAQNKKDFLTVYAASFLDWVYYMMEAEVIEQRIELCRESLEKTQQKRAHNLVDEVDVIRAENSLSLCEQNRVMNESNIDALIKELEVLTGDNSLSAKIPIFNLYEIHELPPLDSIPVYLEYNSLSLQQLDIILKQLELNRKYNLESMKQDLSLTGQLSIASSEAGFTDALVIDKPSAAFMLTYTFPLRNTSAKANLATSELTIEQMRLKKKELEISMISTISNLHVQLTRMERILDMNRQQIEFAERQTVAEMETYDQGRNDLSFVIQAQDSEKNARMTYDFNALTYQKLYIQYLSLMDKQF